jgi:polyvinyl alcohol dehydrogenase (cytochrome)
LVAEYVTGKRFDPAAFAASNSVQVVNRCSVDTPMRPIGSGASWNGFGNGAAGTRFQPATAAKLSAADLPRLKLKWAFGYANVSAVRALPAVAGGRLFTASENGEVHALDPRTGCSHWTFKAKGGVRSALSVGPYQVDGRRGQAVFFGDNRANVYAVDAQDGQLLWTTKIDLHTAAGITGSPTLHAGVLYVPVQGLGEEGRGGLNNYPCCTFRGSLVALEASTGLRLWKSWTIDAPQPRATNALGVQMWGPAGGGIWSAPVVDAKRGVVYVSTGNGYADPVQKMTNSVIAFDMKTGVVRWHQQLLAADQWTMGCQPTNPDNPSCPAVMGPDMDFSASPLLVRQQGRDIIVIPQKSALMWALDPDKGGAVLWQRSFAKGSGLGGQWGAASDGVNVYTGVNDFHADKQGGVHAFRVVDGQPLWSSPPQPLLCGEKRQGCDAGQGAAVTLIPGAALVTSRDGGLRAYDTRDGRVLWTQDTAGAYQTVNGVAAKGGSMDAEGVVVAGGMVYVHSGYGGLVGSPGNVLLAYGLD